MYCHLLYCCRPEHLIFHRHLLRSNISLDLANLLQVGFDLRNTLERKILSPKIKASDRRQYTKRSLVPSVLIQIALESFSIKIPVPAVQNFTTCLPRIDPTNNYRSNCKTPFGVKSALFPLASNLTHKASFAITSIYYESTLVNNLSYLLSQKTFVKSIIDFVLKSILIFR